MAHVSINVAQVKQDEHMATWLQPPRRIVWVPAVAILLGIAILSFFLPLCYSRSEIVMCHPETGEVAVCVAYDIEPLRLPFSGWAKSMCFNKMKEKGMVPVSPRKHQ